MTSEWNAFCVGLLLPIVTFAAYNGYRAYKKFQSDMNYLKAFSGVGMYINTVGHVMNFVATMISQDESRGRSAMNDCRYQSWYESLTTNLDRMRRAVEQLKKEVKLPEDDEKKECKNQMPRPFYTMENSCS